jgi:hypothetical protein
MLTPLFHQFFWPGRIIEQMQKASAAGWQRPWMQAG